MGIHRAVRTVAIAGASSIVTSGIAGDPGFREEAAIRGVNYHANTPLPYGAGIALVDLDGDGDLDLVAVGAANGLIGAYENDGTGHFTPRPLGLLIPGSFASGVTAADFDRDGDADLHVTRRMRPDLLLRNDGNFSFTDVAPAMGVDDSGDGHGAAWGDFDGDGWVDLVVANRNQPNRLYRSSGRSGRSLRFVDVAPALGVDRGTDPTFQASFLDFDRDGDLDLYYATDHGLECAQFSNHLYENVGGVFVEVTDEETQGCLDAMSIAIGDVDGNGYPDLFCTNTESGHGLMLNRGDGRWRRAEDLAGVATFAVGWGALFGDFDQDGRMDLFVAHAGSSLKLYRGTGQWPMDDVTEAWGLDDVGFAYGCATGDVDGDGDLDLVVSRTDQPVRVYINAVADGRPWIGFEVMPAVPGHPVLGSSVDVRIGSTWMTRDVLAGDAFKSQSDVRPIFGTAGADEVDEITVRWANGETRGIRGLPAGQRWPLWPTSRLGDADGDGDRDPDDLAAMAACYSGQGVPMSPDCTIMDMDGDGDVDTVDCHRFIAAGYDGPVGDCDGDGIPDPIEIARGFAIDADLDGRPDDCLADLHPADLDRDGTIGGGDLQLLIGAWGTTDARADLDGSGEVGFADLVILLASWAD